MANDDLQFVDRSLPPTPPLKDADTTLAALQLYSLDLDEDVRPLRLLSLDSGGGIRTLSQLLLLDHVMTAMQARLQLADQPKPCDVFDLIGGCGAGGIVALFLGRLRMSISEALTAWTTLGADVYSHQNRKYGREGSFKSIALSQKMYELCTQADLGQTLYELDQDRPTGKCFVCAFPAGGSIGEPECLRSYQTRFVPSGGNGSRRASPGLSIPSHFNYRIEEAARITASDVPFLEGAELIVGGRTETFACVGDAHHNPINTLFQEAAALFGPKRRLGCVLSLGAGHPGVQGDEQPKMLFSMKVSSLERFANFHAKQAEVVHLGMRRRFAKLGHCYGRLNVAHGLESISVEEWGRREDVERFTRRYILDPDVEERVDGLVECMVGGPGVVVRVGELAVPAVRMLVEEEERRWLGAADGMHGGGQGSDIVMQRVEPEPPKADSGGIGKPLDLLSPLALPAPTISPRTGSEGASIPSEDGRQTPWFFNTGATVWCPPSAVAGQESRS